MRSETHTIDQDEQGVWYVLKDGKPWTRCLSRTQAVHLIKLIQQPQKLPPDDNTNYVVSQLIQLKNIS